MKILTLRLENFQGIRNAEFDFGGHSATIYGANEAGKTTVFNAITWLLFGQASTGAKNFNPKTIGEDGELHGLNHSVEAVFLCDDSSELRLTRVFREVYTKKRGSAVESFSGHTTEYYVDAVPVAEKAFNECLESMFDSTETARMLTMPDYFPERLTWQHRRKLLLDICGDIPDQDVIASSPELSDITSILRKPGNTTALYTVDEYKAIAQRSMTDINRGLQGIPSRIDEAQKAIPTDLDGAMSWTDADAECGVLRRKIASLEETKSGGPVTAAEIARQELLKAKNDLEESRRRYDDTMYANTKVARDQVVAAETVLATARRTLRDDKDKLARLEADRKACFERREELTRRYDDVFKRSYAGDDTCPTCGQRLPEDSINAAVAAFNLKKSDELAEINRLGKECSKDVLAARDAEIKLQNEAISSADAAVAAAERRLAEATAAVKESPAFETTATYEKLIAEVKEAERKVENLDGMRDRVHEAVDKQIAEIREKLQEAERLCAKYDIKQRQKLRISELETQEKQLSAQYEEMEKNVYLCEQFVRAKVSLLTSRINARFRSVSFILFNEQINGGLTECCEVAVPAADGSLIPYAFANTAARINAGIEIIAVLSEHFGISLPVVVDNAESITHINSDGIDQLIRLVVSDSDRNLRMEVA